MSVTKEEHVYKVGDHALLPYTNADLEVEIVETVGSPRRPAHRPDPAGDSLREAEAEEWDVPAKRLRPVTGAA